MTTSLQGRKVVLIGGAGFIGHNMALQLKRRGVEVEVVDGLQVNNLLTFSSSAETQINRELYLRFIRERLDLLYAAGIPLHAHALATTVRHEQGIPKQEPVFLPPERGVRIHGVAAGTHGEKPLADVILHCLLTSRHGHNPLRADC